MSWDPAVVGRSVILDESPLETQRFGLSFSRALVPLATAESSFDDVRRFLQEDEADVVVLRYPAARVDWFARMLDSGRDLIVADSLTYWRLAVGKGRRPGDVADLAGGVSRDVDPRLVDELVDSIFTGYGSHYLANPLLAPADALAGYREWAQHSALNLPVATLTSKADGIVGLATLESAAQTCEILLAGIVPGVQQRGYYAHLLAACEGHAADTGATDLVISTQTHNAKVQRAWARYGFEPVGSFLTVHSVRKGLLPSQGPLRA